MSEGVRKLSVEFDDKENEYYIRHDFGTHAVVVQCFTDTGEMLMPVIVHEDSNTVIVKPMYYLLDPESGEMYEVPFEQKIAKIVVIG
jgi:hypothetical protein